MRAQLPRLAYAIAFLAVLSCGGGSDGGPTETPVIILSHSSLSLLEGTPETLTVALDAAPAADLSVALASNGKVTLLPTTLDFTPANFSTPKSVVITPLEDVDLVPGNDTVTATATGLVTVKVPVAIAEDDSQAVVLDTTALTIVEGDSAHYGVRLAYQPAGSVNVAVTPSDGQVTVSPSILNFTPGDYDTPKQVTVHATQDSDLVDGPTLHILTSVVGGGGFASLPVNVTDDDAQAIVLAQDSVTLVEGDSVTVSVRLAFQPATTVTVNIASLDSAVAVPGLASVQFTPANYATFKTLKVRAIQDSGVTADSTIIRFQSAGIGQTDLKTRVADDDHQALLLNTHFIFTTEGATDSFSVRLAYKPAADVPVFLAAGLMPRIFTPQTSFTFTPNNWDTPQIVYALAMQDEDLEVNSDAVYLLTGIPGIPGDSVRFLLNDDDVQAIVVDSSSLHVVEGDSVDLAVHLAFKPSGSTNVLIASMDDATATVNTPFLNFLPGNYSTPQNVRVKATPDNDLVDGNTTVRLSGTEMPNVDVPVNVTDDDTQAFVTSVDTVFVTEGLSTSLTITLAYQPSSSTFLTLGGFIAAVATVSPTGPGSFSQANYTTGFTVLITGTEDANTLTDMSPLYLTAPGVPPKLIVVIVADND